MKRAFFIFILTIITSSSTFSQKTTFIENLWFWETYHCDDCYDCDGINGKKGNQTVETKEVSAFCDGKDIGEWKINYVQKCIGERNEKEYYTVSTYNQEFNTEYEARSHIQFIAEQLCSEGKIQTGYVTSEMKRQKRQERQKRHDQLMDDYRNGKIIPDTMNWYYQILPSTLSGEEIVKYDWELKEGSMFGIIVQTKRIKFNPDGTFYSEIFEALTAPKIEKGTWEILNDNTILLIHEPRISDLVERVTVYKEKLSFWETIGSYRVSSSKLFNQSYSAKRILKENSKNIWSLDGDWYIKVQGYPRNEIFEITAKLRVEGNNVSGQFLSAKLDDQEQCSDTKINGTIDNGQFSLTIEYFDETCSGQKYTLQGTMEGEGKFFGQFHHTVASKYSNGKRGYGAIIRTRKSMDKAKVTGIKMDANFQNAKKKLENPFGIKTLNGTFETLDGWSCSGGKVKLEGRTVSLIPNKNKTPIIFTSDTFQVSTKGRYLHFGINSKSVFSGDIRVSVIDVESGAREEVFFDRIRNSLDKANGFLDGLSKGKIPKPTQPKRSSNGIVTKPHKVKFSKYQGKNVQLEIYYKTYGLAKSKIYVENIRVGQF